MTSRVRRGEPDLPVQGRRISEGVLDGFGRVDYPVCETAADQAILSGEMAAGLFGCGRAQHRARSTCCVSMGA
jgi:hypothetical protein